MSYMTYGKTTFMDNLTKFTNLSTGTSTASSDGALRMSSNPFRKDGIKGLLPLEFFLKSFHFMV